MMRATASRSTSLRFLRAAWRRAALARRSVSRIAPRAASWIMATASEAKSSAVTADAGKAHAHIFSGVGWRERVDAKAPMETGKEGAIASHAKPIQEVGQTDEDKRQERATVPLVIEQDVEVVERVLVEELSLVEQEDGMNAIVAEVSHVGGDRMEDAGRGGGGREAEGDAELAIEIAATEGGVVAVGEAKTSVRQSLAQSAQHARLADARIADEDGRRASLDDVA